LDDRSIEPAQRSFARAGAGTILAATKPATKADCISKTEIEVKDQRGVATSATNIRSLEFYERALKAFNTYLGDPLATIDEALTADPDFIMGHVLRGHIHVSLWERSVVPEVKRIVARLDGLARRSNDREQRHASVLEKWASGEWAAARHELDRLLAEYPRDLLAIQIGHLMDFAHGDRENLRGRIARALPAWTPDDSGYGFLLGMHAFGLEECGSYGMAEETARRALAIEPNDCWAHHAAVHVMEMQARQAEGIAFVEERVDHWAQPTNTFQFHNWWHAALFHLDQDHFKRALQIYDRGVHAEPTKIQLLLLDAVALLWRMQLRDIDVGNRWEELAVVYENDGEGGFYAFNDVHAIIAFVATGRTGAMAARLADIEAAAQRQNTNAMMTRSVGLTIARGLVAFGRERYRDAVDCLMPVRYQAHAFGGSHAQRDIIHRTLIEAATRAGEKALARALCNERTSLKPHCPYSWQLRKRVDHGTLASRTAA
jgi:tetratricopeptide (TPR) repeat protein